MPADDLATDGRDARERRAGTLVGGLRVVAMGVRQEPGIFGLAVGGAALYLLSDLSGAVTGEVHYVDCGYNAVAMPSLEMLKEQEAQAQSNQAAE